MPKIKKFLILCCTQMFRFNRLRRLSTLTIPKIIKPVPKCNESLLGLPNKILLKSELDASLNEKKRFGEAYLETRAVVRDGDKLLGKENICKAKLCIVFSP